MQPSTLNSDSYNHLFIFRRDLRIHDNTGLLAFYESVGGYVGSHAGVHDSAGHLDKQSPQQKNSKQQANKLALYVLTPKQWLQHDMALVQAELILRTLPILAESLYQQLGVQLQVLLADDFAESITVIQQFCQDNNVQQVFANHEYELNEINRDKRLAEILSSNNIQLHLYHDQCILPPNSVQNGNGNMYRVFTPFYKKWLQQLEMIPPELHYPHLDSSQKSRKSEQLTQDLAHQENIQQIQSLCKQVLQTYKNAWQAKIAETKTDTENTTEKDTEKDTETKVAYSDKQINDLLQSTRQAFPAGEVHACYRLDQFIAEDISQYDVARDVPSLQATSALSAYLAIGSLSPRLCYVQASKALGLTNPIASIQNNAKEKDIYRWISELAWRDFYRHVLVTRADLIKHQAYLIDVDKKVTWSYDKADFSKWCHGKTGVPIVDSAMRCLNATGFMHNRLRMIVAMFLTKDLLIDWRWGERYFMQTLIDGDFASNNGGWQWSASTGTDSAPYFRIMNPFSQAKTHDPDAIFIKQWLPELQEVEPKILHDEKKLNQFLDANLLVDYPKPMVDHKLARVQAIEMFKG